MTLALAPVACLPELPASSSDGSTAAASTGIAAAAEAEATAPVTTTGSSSAATIEAVAVCGDGVVGGDEQCDDGDQDDGDACNNACVLAACGDGVVQASEACDDGNSNDFDACRNNCVLASCGDQVVQIGEACDEGSETPTCNANCTISTCGDGVLNMSAGEACDDGNNDKGDSCLPDCANAEVVDLAVGGQHTCIVLADGALRCWGQNEYGALGNGDTEDLGDDPGELPVPNVETSGKVVQVSSGGYHHCALFDSGNMYCCGYDGHGVLGYGGVFSKCASIRETPPVQVDVGASVLSVAAGGLHTCVIVTGKTVRCWGYGAKGQLGRYDKDDLSIPPQEDVPGVTGAVQLALGVWHTCVLQEDETVRCWGNNTHGELGLGHKDVVEAPPPALALGGPVQAIAAGGYHTCALMKDGLVRCWGYGFSGQLGNGKFGTGADVGDEPGEMPPASAVDLGEAASQIAAGYHHTCALLVGGGVKCWGEGSQGALGYASSDDIDLPGEFSSLAEVSLGGPARLLRSGSGYEDLASRGQSTCAVLEDNSLRCWGRNQFGQLGHGHRNNIGDDEQPNDEKSAGPVHF